MAQGLGGDLIAYLDTQTALWLCAKELNRLSPRALNAINNHDLLISPIVLVEMNFLYQIRRIIRTPQDLVRQLRAQIGVEICKHPLTDIGETALSENWTRHPFDLLIVSHAKANNYAPLVTSDELIRQNYPRAIW